MVNKLAIGIGAAVLVFVILFCVVPFKQVSYEATEQYQAPETVYASEPYTTYSPAAGQPEVTLYQDVPKQIYVWKERTVTLYKNVSMLEYLIGY